jgi:hypothetical protein
LGRVYSWLLRRVISGFLFIFSSQILANDDGA